MVDDRAPGAGPLIAALAAALLAISVFMPWYGVSVTAFGAAAARQEITAVAQHYGNTILQAQANRLGAEFDSLVGRRIVTVSAYQSMGRVSLILLGLAGIALLASLLRLVDARGQLYARGDQIAFVGAVAAVVVGLRMIWKPGTGVDLVSLSLSWGICLALLSAIAASVGGLMARSEQMRKRATHKVGPGPPPLASRVPFSNR